MGSLSPCPTCGMPFFILGCLVLLNTFPCLCSTFPWLEHSEYMDGFYVCSVICV